MKRILALPLVGMLLVLFAPCGWADSYAQTVARQLTATNHVVVSDGASPALPNPEGINQQIISSAVPVWVINIPKGQTDQAAVAHANVATDPIHNALFDVHNPVTNPIVVDGQTRRPPMIMLVIDGNGYHAWSYDVAKSVADATGSNIVSAASQHRGDLYGAVSAFISLMATTPNTGPVVSGVVPPPPPAKPTNWAFAWGLLWTFCAIVVCGAIFMGVRTLVDSRRAKERLRQSVNDRITSAGYDVSQLAEEVLRGKDISGAQNRADAALANAKDSYAANKIDAAESHVSVAERAISDAYTQLGTHIVAHTPKREHVTDAESDAGSKKRYRATITARSLKGTAVTIDSSDYKPKPEPGYRNYFRGGKIRYRRSTTGTFNYVYLNPGYYPYPFWSPGWDLMNVVMLNDVLTTPTLSDYGYHHSYSGSTSGGGSSSSSSSYSGSHSSGGSSSYSPSRSSSDYSGSSSGGGSIDFGFGGGFGGFSGGSSGGGSAGF